VKAILNEYQLAFPVMTVAEKAPGAFDAPGDVLGTAFLLGEGCLMTAGHVAKALLASDNMPALILARPGSGGADFSRIVDIETLSHDLGIIRVPTTDEGVDPVIPWYVPQVGPMQDLWAIGYPYGLLPAGEARQFVQRIFRGHAVSTPSQYELPADDGRPVRAYELSFQAPRGLSGAPLFVNLDEPSMPPAVVGVVVGNSSQSMIVHSTRETDASGASTSVVERHESLSLGIAVQALSACSLSSRILGTTVGNFLDRRGALRHAL